MENELKAEGLSNRLNLWAEKMVCLQCLHLKLLFSFIGEGLGMVAVEAQAAGLPVLASDTVPEEAIVCRWNYLKKTFEGAQLGKGY